MPDHDKLMEAREMALIADGNAKLALAQIASHEKVCSERYDAIFNGLDKINGKIWYLVIGVSGSLIVGLAAVIIMLIKNGGHL